MKCQLCGESAASQRRYLVWSQVVWLIMATRAIHKYYDCPCCDHCARKGDRLTLRRTFLVGGFMMLAMFSIGMGLFVFSLCKSPILGGALGGVTFLLLILGLYRAASRPLQAPTSELLGRTTGQFFKARRKRDRWTLFDSVTVAKKAPGGIRIHALPAIEASDQTDTNTPTLVTSISTN